MNRTPELLCKRLEELARMRTNAEEAIATTVQESRKAGVSWTQIGGALGVTKQSVQRKYG